MERNTEGAPPGSLAVADGAIMKAFAKYDKNGSGQMEAKELRGCLRSLGVLVDEAEGDEVIARYDADANGVLTIDEFEAMVRALETLRAKYTTREKRARQSSSASMPAPEGKRAEAASSCAAACSESDVSEASEATQAAMEAQSQTSGGKELQRQIERIRPRLETVLRRQGLEMDDVLPSLQSVEAVQQLERVLDNPEEFLAVVGKVQLSA